MEKKEEAKKDLENGRKNVDGTEKKQGLELWIGNERHGR